MGYKEAVLLALGSLRTNKLRSLLTLLGIIVGISSVIAIMTLGHAVKVQNERDMASMGINDLMVSVMPKPEDDEAAPPANAGPGQFFGVEYKAPDENSKFDMESIEQIKSVMGDSIAGIPVYEATHGTAGDAEMQTDIELRAVNIDYLKLNELNLVQGRTLSQQDIDDRRPVALVPENLIDSLGLVSQDVLGKEIEVETVSGASRSIVVVGIYAQKQASASSLMGNMDHYPVTYVPYTVADRFGSTSNERWESLSVRPAQGEDLLLVKARLQGLLTQMYSKNPQFEAKVQDYKQEAEAISRFMDTLSIAISAIGGISLLVGGIGVMNIMLVAVTERTREIGIRKALGARKRDIRRQFVVESMIVCLIGGLLGVALGGAIGMIGAKLIAVLVLPPLNVVLVALLFSLGIGVFFGYYPANKAAKLEPIEALRYE